MHLVKDISDRRRVELGADVTPARIRWMSNNYIARGHRQVQLVGVSLLGFEAMRTSFQQRVGPSGLPVEQPRRMRKEVLR